MTTNIPTHRRSRAAAVLAAVLLSAQPSLAPAQTAPAAASAAQRALPLSAPGLAADPAIRFGVLPNGMRYALRRNATPPGQASLRLRFDAGSMAETNAQQGLAHFLEHMAFNGSKTVPEGEMVKTLERLGLAFGADTNAATSFDETTYRLDLPKTDDDTVNTALHMLRDVASELTIAQDAVDRERGVVLSEERARDTPSYRVFTDRFAFLLKGQRPPQRLPIGKVEVLKTASRDRILAYYQAYYRPERAILVAVGDFDVDAMEARIKARFGDWKATGANGSDPVMGPVAPRSAEAKVRVEPGAALSLQIAWVKAPDLTPDSVEKRGRALTENLGLAVLNRRLGALSRSANPPFIAAGVSKGDQFHAAEVTTLAVTARPGQWSQALAAVDLERRRAVRYGVRQDELDREIEEYRSGFKAAAAGAATRRTPNIAADILSSMGEHEVPTDPVQDQTLFETLVKGVTAAQASAALRAAFDGQGPLLFLATPTPIAGGDKALLDAFAAAGKVEATPPAAPTATTWPYGAFGGGGKVAEQRDIADLDTVFVRFENGVRLTVKPTKFRDDQVLVGVQVGSGLAGAPADRQSPGWASSALIEGGLKQISSEDMERVLAAKTYGIGFGVTDDALAFSGRTTREDLDTQMQVLAAYVAEPGWRQEAFDRIVNYGATLHDQYEATDAGVLRRDLAGLLHGGDRRWTFPSREEIAGAKLDALKDMIAPSLARDPIEVVIVGDTTVEKAIAATAATFGALPARADAAGPVIGKGVAFPASAAAPIVRTHNGRADQAIAYLAWPTDDFFADTRRARAAQVMADILKLRLTDELREKQGATYSPSVGFSASQTWSGYGYLAASEEAPPALMDGFFRDVAKIAADLRGAPVTADELARAKTPRLDALEKARATNEYWLGQLTGAQTDPRRLQATRSAAAQVEAVTAADIQAVAQRYLRDDKAWKLVIKPKS